jgi:hypothetical protein
VIVYCTEDYYTRYEIWGNIVTGYDEENNPIIGWGPTGELSDWALQSSNPKF